MAGNEVKIVHPLVFVHLPRTGGITLGRVIDRQYGRKNVFRLYATARFDTSDALSELDRMPHRKRATLRALIGHQRFGLYREYFERATCITMLREPVDRTIAYYYYILNNPGHYFHRTLVEKRVRLREFVRNPQSIEFDNYQTRQLSDSIGVPIGRCSREMLAQACENLERCTVFGLTSFFDESVVLMKRTLGWSSPYYEKLNVGQSRASLDSLSPDTVESIVVSNQLDVELYEFARKRFTRTLEEQSDSFHREVRRFRTHNSMIGSVTKMVRRLAPVDTTWR